MSVLLIIYLLPLFVCHQFLVYYVTLCLISLKHRQVKNGILSMYFNFARYLLMFPAYLLFICTLLVCVFNKKEMCSLEKEHLKAKIDR